VDAADSGSPCRAHARATLFILGDGIAAHEQILKRALAEGHELGLHGWSHPHLTELSDAEIRDEMLTTQKAIERATGIVARVWRPPTSRSTSECAKRLPVAIWSRPAAR